MLTITPGPGCLCGAMLLVGSCFQRLSRSLDPLPTGARPPTVTQSPTVVARPRLRFRSIRPPRRSRPRPRSRSTIPSTLPGLSDADAASPVSPPEVLLSAEHEATCLVKVESAFPAVSLQTLEGEGDSPDGPLGQRLTVVVFWNGQHPMAVEQISRLDQEVQQPLCGGRRGGVMRSTSATRSRICWNLLPQIDHGFVNLRDPDRQAYSQIATSLLPRTLPAGRGRKDPLAGRGVFSHHATRIAQRDPLPLRQQLEDSERQAEPLM